MPESASGGTGGLTLGDYLRVLWRWKWMILIAVCASGLAAYAYSSHQAPQYKATSQLLYVEPVDPTNPLATSYTNDARDAAVQNGRQRHGQSCDRGPREARSRACGCGQVRRLDIGDGGSHHRQRRVIDVTATGGDPRVAVAVSNAYAQAVVDWRKEQQLARVSAAIAAVKANLAGFTTKGSRLTSGYATLKQNLQNLQLLQMTSSGDFKLVSPAVPAGVAVCPEAAAVRRSWHGRRPPGRRRLGPAVQPAHDQSARHA